VLCAEAEDERTPDRIINGSRNREMVFEVMVKSGARTMDF
jgi:hypothetical protein